MKEYKGLSENEAQRRLRENGENTIEAGSKSRPLLIFVNQFRDIMVIILLGATAISLILGDFFDSITIIAIVLMNAILGFIQEYRTERTLEKLKELAAPEASVIRNTKLRKIPSKELVCGDIILLRCGDKIPADCVVLQSADLFSDESPLTGESVPVHKENGKMSHSDNSIGQSCVLYSGCSITKGKCVAMVIATGKNTQMGNISTMIDDISAVKTPLQIRLGELGKTLALICIGVCIAVFLAGILRGEPVFDMLMTGISIAIAAIPEGLPATVTIALALAVNRMLRQKALVNKLHSVETLGCTSVICTDKTGTLTMNKMCVKHIRTAEHEYSFTGQGYSMHGSVTQNGEKVHAKDHSDLSEALKCAVICSSSRIDKGKSSENFDVSGDPTEIAMLIASAKGGITAQMLSPLYRKVDEIAFDSKRKRMTVLCDTATGISVSYTKGAFDIIFSDCDYYIENSEIKRITPEFRKIIESDVNKYTSQGLRVLLLAQKVTKHKADCERSMIFLGVAAMLDPPRSEVKAAIAQCKRAHIRPVMITGDHYLTAKSIGKMIGLCGDDGVVITGKELDAMNDNELCEIISDVDIFARVAPAHKLRIVRAFKSKGHIVTMTGDGINDAPAIKEADVGVAMGISGTDVTREAADVVLLDDNFSTLVKAVSEGRGIYANIRKFVRYLLSCNIGEVFTMFIGITFGMPIVLLPVQLLLVNLVTDGLPAIALGLEPNDKNTMNRKPRKSTESFFANGLASKIAFRGIFIGLCTLGCFSLVLSRSATIEQARTCAMITLVFSQLIHVFECKSETGGLFSVNYLNNPKLILAVIFSAIMLMCALFVPQLRIVFGFAKLSGHLWRIALAFAFAVPILSGIFGKNK
ncbi:MAG: cation-translocating P-type ATPase [Oscillospiraceae bacterium]|nr:cation-translocating P-type ATPase [Oscillospiraceae bacterium]